MRYRHSLAKGVTALLCAVVFAAAWFTTGARAAEAEEWCFSTCTCTDWPCSGDVFCEYDQKSKCCIISSFCLGGTGCCELNNSDCSCAGG